MYIIGMTVLVAFAIIGLCSFIAGIINMIYCGREDFLIVLNHPKADTIEMNIRRAAKICREYKGSSVLCICKQDDPAYDIARLLQKEYPFIEIRDSL